MFRLKPLTQRHCLAVHPVQLRCSQLLPRIQTFVPGTHRSSSQLTTSGIDGRARLSRVFTPTAGFAADDAEGAHAKLIKAAILRQAHSGIFHLLPLGLRIQEKIEKLIDKYMQRLGASKVALSTISSEELWRKTGRYKADGELFTFNDRKKSSFLLSPTHEEEITSLVASNVSSYRQLPLRLYQISRKYRDELRPRHGLLRAREFVMKDLYTFDYREDLALETYHAVRQAYVDLFNELKVPYLVAEADSGDIGGDLSHEFHFPTPTGEDHIIDCDSCGYVANEERAETAPIKKPFDTQSWSFVRDRRTMTLKKDDIPGEKVAVWRGVTRDRSTLINLWYPLSHKPINVNAHAVKSVIPQLDSGATSPLDLWKTNLESTKGGENAKIINLVDGRLPPSFLEHALNSPEFPVIPKHTSTDITIENILEKSLDFMSISDGDNCPRCNSGTLRVQKAIELGHTFHLGTKYSTPLDAKVTAPASESSEVALTKKSEEFMAVVPMQMGCHGIGVTRLIGAVADILADEKGLNWPRIIAPYEVVIISSRTQAREPEFIYDLLTSKSTSVEASMDVIIDDRLKDFGWKMKDADRTGYPVIVIAGRGLESETPTCEVQCRQLKVKENVEVDKLRDYVGSLLSRL